MYFFCLVIKIETICEMLLEMINFKEEEVIQNHIYK